MQSQRTAPPRESELAGVVPSVRPPTSLPPVSEQQRRAGLQQALLFEMRALSQDFSGVGAYIAQASGTTEESTLFASGGLSAMTLTLSENPGEALVQRDALSRLQREMHRFSKPPISIEDQGDGTFRLTNNAFLPLSAEEKAALTGLLQAASQLDSESMMAFIDVYEKFKHYVMRYTLANGGERFLPLGGAGEIFRALSERCADVRDMQLGALTKIAAGERGSVDLDAINAAVDSLAVEFENAYFAIGEEMERACTEGVEDAESLLLKTGAAVVGLTDVEREIFSKIVERYEELAFQIPNIALKFAAYFLCMPAGRATSAGPSGLPTEEEIALLSDFTDVSMVLGSLSARVRFAELSYDVEQFETFRSGLYRREMPDAGTFDVDAYMAQLAERGELPESIIHFVANREGIMEELSSLRGALQAYGLVMRHYATQIVNSREFMEVYDARRINELTGRFSFVDSGISESGDLLSLVRNMRTFSSGITGGIEAVVSAGERIPDIQYDNRLMREFREGDFWDSWYAFSKYFVVHKGATFLFWASMASLGLGMAFRAAAVGMRAAAATELIGGGATGRFLTRMATSDFMTTAASMPMRAYFASGMRAATDAMLVGGAPVWASALSYLAGNRSDDVYEDLNLMGTFFLLRAGAGVGATGEFLPRLASAGGALASGTRFVEDLRRGELFQATLDAVCFAVAGRMFVKTIFGPVSFADSGSAAGTVTVSGATGSRVIDIAGRVAGGAGTVLDWGATAYTPLGFASTFAGISMFETMAMWTRETPGAAMAYEEGGVSGLQDHFSRVYAASGNFMPFITIIFHVPGGVARLAGSRYFHGLEGLAGLENMPYMESMALVVPTTNPARSAIAASLGAAEVAEDLARTAGYATDDQLMVIRQAALSETRPAAEDLLAQLGAENTAAARRWVERTLYRQLDDIWEGAEWMAPGHRITRAQDRQLTTMLERAGDLRRSLVSTVATGASVAIAIGASAYTIHEHLPAAEGLLEAQDRMFGALTAQDGGTSVFMGALASGMYPGMGRQSFGIGQLIDFMPHMSHLLSQIEAGAQTEYGRDMGVFLRALSGEKDRENAVLAFFLSLAAHGRLDPELAQKSPAHFAEEFCKFGERLGELRGAGMVLDGLNLSDMFLLSEYFYGGNTDGSDMVLLWQRSGGVVAGLAERYGQAEPGTMEPYFGQFGDFWRQISRMSIAISSYALENGKDYEWMEEAMVTLRDAVESAYPSSADPAPFAHQVSLWRAEMLYALLSDPVNFSTPYAMRLVDYNTLVMGWLGLFDADPRFKECWYLYYPNEEPPYPLASQTGQFSHLPGL